MFVRNIAVSAATALLFAVGNAAAANTSPFPSGASETGGAWNGNVGAAGQPGHSLDVSAFPSGSNELSGNDGVALMYSKASGTASAAVRMDENNSDNSSPFPSAGRDS